MSTLRIIVAILVGYVIFASASMLLVAPVMAYEGLMSVVLGLVGLTLVGLVSGYIARAISGRNRRLVGYILAGLVMLATLANLVMRLGAEPDWYKVGTLLLTAPVILLVGLRGPRGKKTD